MTAFYARLRDIRQKSGKKLQDVADFLGIELRSYQAYEGGTRQPNIERLIALADFFDVSLDYLMGRVDQDRPWRTGTGATAGDS